MIVIASRIKLLTGADCRTLDEIKSELRAFLTTKGQADLIIDPDDVELLLELASIYYTKMTTTQFINEDVMRELAVLEDNLFPIEGEILKPLDLKVDRDIVERFGIQFTSFHKDLYFTLQKNGLLFIKGKKIFSVEDIYKVEQMQEWAGTLRIFKKIDQSKFEKMIGLKHSLAKQWEYSKEVVSENFLFTEIIDIFSDRKIINAK